MWHHEIYSLGSSKATQHSHLLFACNIRIRHDDESITIDDRYIKMTDHVVIFQIVYQLKSSSTLVYFHIPWQIYKREN